MDVRASELPNHAMIDIKKQDKPSLSIYARFRDIDFCFVLASVRFRFCPIHCARPRLCYVRRYYFVLSWSYSYTAVAGIKLYVRKLQLLALSVIPPVVAAARGHSPAPKALLQYSSGPSTDPWGTPNSARCIGDRRPQYETCCVRSATNERIHSSAVFVRPNATSTPWVKKQDTKLLAITSLTIIGFSNFFSLADSLVNLQQIHV